MASTAVVRQGAMVLVGVIVLAQLASILTGMKDSTWSADANLTATTAETRAWQGMKLILIGMVLIGAVYVMRYINVL